MSALKAVVVATEVITPYGFGVDACWHGLMAGRSAISHVTRFSTGSFFSDCGGTVAGLSYLNGESLVMQLLGLLFEKIGGVVPGDARLLLATTKGEIDLLERSVIKGVGDMAESSLNNLLGKVADLTGTNRDDAMVISSACTSSSAAVARGAALIRNGHSDCVLVVACDSVTEFVFSGFSSLMALDKVPSRPFDRNRGGLTVGEAAGYVVLMSDERAAREGRAIIGEIAGWGMSDDANHMTGPSRESEGLVRAIRAALASAGLTPEQIGFISAHGTGTPYNDAMEMGAFNIVFGGRKVPVYSIKGGIGHTMGAAGLVELAIAQRALREKTVPPTVNLVDADDCAVGWVSGQPQSVGSHAAGLMTNAGFSGVNTALVLTGQA